MSVYYGTVTGNTVILPKEVCLTVEVRTRSSEHPPTPLPTTEEQFKQSLVELGLMTEIKKPCPTVALTEPILVRVKGKPLSEMIIEERR